MLTKSPNKIGDALTLELWRLDAGSWARILTATDSTYTGAGYLDTTESRWLGDRIRNISVTGTGKVVVTPDIADLRLGRRPRPAERILRHQRMQAGIEDDDGRERRGRHRNASREACGQRPHGQSTMILLANIAP